MDISADKTGTTGKIVSMEGYFAEFGKSELPLLSLVMFLAKLADFVRASLFPFYTEIAQHCCKEGP